MQATTSGGLGFDLTDEQQMLREMVHDFVERECPKPVAHELEKAGEFPRDLMGRMAAAGLYGIGVAEELGGQGGDLVDQVLVCEELSRSLGGLSVMWHLNAWSGGKALAHHGTREQQERLLPKLAAGELLFAFAMTEAAGGTDVLRGMRTKATPVDGGWTISGTKIWSTLAHVADKILVLARTSKGDKPSQGLSMFMVDGDAPGLVATPIPKIGMRALGSCEVVLEDVFVPDDAVLGEIGSGWSQIVGSLNSERIMTAAMCTGMLWGVYEDAIAYANERQAFGKTIGRMQSIQHGIADMAMKLDVSRLLTYRSAWLQAAGRPCGVESATAKCMASEYAVESADYGIQILGGYGYAEEYDMQRYWRDARLYRVGPISNEMVRNYIGESIGLGRSF